MRRRLILPLATAMIATAAGGASPVEDRFIGYLPDAKDCLAGPVPEAACVGVVEKACLSDAGDIAETARGKTDCALGAAQIWIRIGEDIVAEIAQDQGADTAATVILSRHQADWRAWMRDICDLERRMQGGPLMKQLITAQCRSRRARDHAIALWTLRSELK